MISLISKSIQSKKCIKSTFVFAKAENQAVGTQYAQALLDVAKSTNDLDSIRSDVDILSAVVNENAGLRDLMVNPLVSSEKKISLLNQISTEGSFNNFTSNFLRLLVEKARIDCIVEILESFETLYCKASNTQIVILKSAVALDEEQQFLIAKKIQELAKSKSVKIKPFLDETLIGGFTVEYGSSQIDLSIKGAFERVKKELNSVAV
jgi:F-type H+-transporting ATPase subunit delta